MAAFKLFGEYMGKPVYQITLTNGIIEADLLSFGATLRSLRVADKNGVMTDVCLGYDSIEEYASNDGYLGATVGRNANRISNSRFSINGKEYPLNANEGKNQLHGGRIGFSHKFWTFSCTENTVTFSIDSPDGDEGFPGNLKACVTFSIQNSSLRIEYAAVSDKDTVVNLTNHAYFNLSGHESGTVSSHELYIGADSYTPCGEGNIPTGAIEAISETALDFRIQHKLSDSLSSLSATDTKGLDHNFVISRSPAAILYSPDSKIEMTCRSSLEGLQVYSAGFLSERKGKMGTIYREHHGICLETQHYPDAVNKSAFPSPILKAGEEYKHWTEYSFKIV